jgi:hypothetical protein
MHRAKTKAILAFLRPLGALLLALLVLQGCNALNPLCGSARPAPNVGSLSASTITFAEVQQGFLLTVNGNRVVSSSVVVVNGTTLSTQVAGSHEFAGHDHSLDLHSWNSQRDGDDSTRNRRRSWLHKWWNQPRARLDYHIAAAQFRTAGRPW